MAVLCHLACLVPAVCAGAQLILAQGGLCSIPAPTPHEDTQPAAASLQRAGGSACCSRKHAFHTSPTYWHVTLAVLNLAGEGSALPPACSVFPALCRSRSGSRSLSLMAVRRPSPMPWGRWLLGAKRPSLKADYMPDLTPLCTCRSCAAARRAVQARPGLIPDDIRQLPQ